MSPRKYLSIALIIAVAGSLSMTYADDLSDAQSALNQSIATLIAKYEARIKSLEQDNASLRAQLALKSTSTTATIAPVTPTVTAPAIIASSGAVDLSKLSTSAIRTQVMNRINTLLPSILSENNLDASGAIGLFEFMDPNAVFVSIDDGKNPGTVTAFKTKILYTYDNALNLTKIGFFDLDYASERYVTKYGSNPYVKATRTRIQNPLYKGRLFDTVVTASGSTNASGTTSTSSTTTSDVTFAQIKAAYDKNKLLDALKLSDSYITKNPNDLNTLKIRYRSYYIIGKYDDSLAEVKKIEAVSGAAFDRTIACDAAVIAKIAKKTDVSTYYGTICKKK